MIPVPWKTGRVRERAVVGYGADRCRQARNLTARGRAIIPSGTAEVRDREVHDLAAFVGRAGTLGDHEAGDRLRAVQVLDDDTVLTRLITAGTSWQGQEPYEAHFGLGAGRDVLRVEIKWPGTDAVSTWAGPAAGRVHTLCCREHLFTEGFE